jgi:hypothetical protein
MDFGAFEAYVFIVVLGTLVTLVLHGIIRIRKMKNSNK